jgi:hypothetical protein
MKAKMIVLKPGYYCLTGLSEIKWGDIYHVVKCDRYAVEYYRLSNGEKNIVKEPNYLLPVRKLNIEEVIMVRIGGEIC